MCSILCLMRSRKRYFSSIPLGTSTTLFCRFSLLQNPEYDPLLSGRIFEYAAEVGQMSGKNGLKEHHFIKNTIRGNNISQSGIQQFDDSLHFFTFFLNI